MATGRPMVVSRSRGLQDYARDTNALLVEPGRPDELGSSVVRVLSDARMAARLGTAAREFVVTTCDGATYAKAIAAHIRDAAAARSGA
jgi:hypothetical protein